MVTTLNKTGNFKSVLLLNCFLLLCNLCCGQPNFNSDSLLKVYNSSAHDSSRTQALIFLSWNLSESDPERSEEYIRKALKIAIALNNKFFIGQAYSGIANNYYLKDDFGNAAKYYLLALEQHEKGRHKTATANVYNNLGAIYTGQGMLTEALRAYERALKLGEGNKEKWKHDVLNNTGIIYCKMENYLKAEENFKEALRIEIKYGLMESAAKSLQNLGNVAINTGKTDEAERLFRRVEVIVDSLGDKAAIRNCLVGISSLYNNVNKHKQAIGYARKARAMIKGRSPLFELEIIYAVFADYERSEGNFKNALLYSDSLIQVSEQLYSTELAAQTAGLIEKYKAEKTEKENILLKKEKDEIEELANKRKLLLGGALVVFVLLIGLIALYIRQNKLQTAQKSIELKHQVLRSQINPHFIFNALNAIQKLYLENKTQLADEYLGDFGHLLRKILDNSSRSYVSIHEEMETLQLYLNLEKNRTEDAFEYEILLQDELDALHLSVPSLIFQPIVENAIWHGLTPKGKGKITISVKKINSKMLEAIVQDNGVGIDASNDQANKLYDSKGMKLVEERLKPEGSLSVVSGIGKGTSIIMLIPYKLI